MRFFKCIISVCDSIFCLQLTLTVFNPTFAVCALMKVSVIVRTTFPLFPDDSGIALRAVFLFALYDGSHRNSLSDVCFGIRETGSGAGARLKPFLWLDISTSKHWRFDIARHATAVSRMESGPADRRRSGAIFQARCNNLLQRGQK